LLVHAAIRFGGRFGVPSVGASQIRGDSLGLSSGDRILYVAPVQLPRNCGSFGFPPFLL